LDLRQLKYFVSTIEQGSLSGAAAEIPISQPALTRSLKQLEEELGVALMLRHARGISPTPAGERYYKHAKSILAECSRAAEDVLDLGGQLSGEISIGVASLFTATMADSILDNFARKHPLVRVTAIQGFLEDLVGRLDRGDIELALCNFPVQAKPDAHILEPLLELNTCVYVRHDHELAGETAPTWREARDARWVNVSQPHSQQALEALFINENLTPPRPPVSTNSLTLIKSLIFRRGFIGLLPELMMASEVASGAVVRLNLPGTPIKRKAGLILRGEGYQRPLADMLADEIRTAFAQIRSGERSLAIGD
jgi:DNA-binding transcriptional LysR family regulator